MNTTPPSAGARHAGTARVPASRGEPDSRPDPRPPGPAPAEPAAHDWFIATLAAMGCRRAGRKWQCPAHGHTGEHAAALSVGARDDGTGAWLHCFAGCSVVDVLRAMGLRPGHLQHPPRVSPTRYVTLRRLSRVWPELKAGPGGGDPIVAGYRHEAWHPYGRDHRKERLRRPGDGSKTVRWESRNPAGQWVPGLLGTRENDLPLYREPELAIAVGAGETVVLCESESSCDAMRGVYATTWAGGADSTPLQRLAHTLAGIDVVIVADHDPAGLRCLDRLTRVLPDARVLLGAPGEDARDLYRRVGPAAFLELLRAAPYAEH